jgi:hypothetical protein
MRSRFEVRDRRWRMEGVRGSEMLTRCISLGLQPLVEERGSLCYAYVQERSVSRSSLTGGRVYEG